MSTGAAPAPAGKTAEKSSGLFSSTLGRFGRKPEKAKLSAAEEAEAIAKDNAPVICGVSLDKPLGENDGSIRQGPRYFTTKEAHGIFVPLSSRKVVIMENNKKVGRGGESRAFHTFCPWRTPTAESSFLQVHRFQCYSPHCQDTYGKMPCYSAACPSRQHQFDALDFVHFVSETVSPLHRFGLFPFFFSLLTHSFLPNQEVREQIPKDEDK